MRVFPRAARGTTASAAFRACAVGLLAAASGAAAAEPPEPAARPAPAAVSAPAESVTESLIRLLAEHNAISRGDAEALIQRLQSEQAVQQAPRVVAPMAPATAATAITPPADGTVRIYYVPESEKKRIREELRTEVLAQAKSENWAQPGTLPEWLGRFSFFGDVRVREDHGAFDDSNNVPFLNFQALNAGAPANINPAAGQLSLPFLNTSEDRDQQRIRARFGFAAQVTEGLSATMRFSTGSTSNPVSTNQTFGPSFNKLGLVVDRAFLDWRPIEGTTLWAGRMPSPFVSTEMLFDDDLNFDGLAARYEVALPHDVTPFVTVGAFSIENTGLDFPNNFAVKESSRDKSLLAAQIGAAWKVQEGANLRGTVAYYDYHHVMGETSSPCVALTSADACDTDHSRPGFVQKGNTLFAIRNLAGIDTNPTAPEFQYFGLASDFGVLDATVELDMALDGPLHAVLTADYARNLEYDRGDAAAKVPVNNYDACPDPGSGCSGPYHSGADAWFVQLLVGRPKVVERWEWNLAGGYRRIEGDAVLDAFTDSDFHLGGTNARGYHLQGSLAFAHNGWLTLRWLSAEEVTGPPLSVDSLFLDLNARF